MRIPSPSSSSAAMCFRRQSRRQWLWAATAVALQQHQQHQFASSFVLSPPPAKTASAASRRGIANMLVVPKTTPTPTLHILSTQKPTTTKAATVSRTTTFTRIQPYSTSRTALDMSLNNNGNGNSDGGGFRSRVKKFAKSTAKAILPKKWFQSSEEQRAEIEKQKVKDEIKGGLTEILKGAPLPIRMLGRMITPLISTAMSSMAAQMKQQQETMQETLRSANTYIANDAVVKQVFGDEGVQLSQSPFSQSSASRNINGQISAGIELGVRLTALDGSGRSGVAQISATEQGIQKIIVAESGTGRTINVSLSKTGNSRFSSSGSSSSSGGRKSGRDDNIIEAEIIEKDYNRKT